MRNEIPIQKTAERTYQKGSYDCYPDMVRIFAQYQGADAASQTHDGANREIYGSGQNNQTETNAQKA